MNNIDRSKNVDQNIFDAHFIKGELAGKDLSPIRGINLDILSQRTESKSPKATNNDNLRSSVRN